MAIKGILPVIPLPFRDGRFDRDSFARLLDHMLEHVDGYTLLGSVGEAPSLPAQARREIAEAALELTPRDRSVVVGVSHTSAEEAVELARHAQAHGAAGVLCASPFYYPNGEDGLRRFFHRLDAALEIDLVLYDNPEATRTRLAADTVVAWSRELGHLRSVKLTDHDLSKIEVWHAAGLSVLGGDDPILFRYLAAGVDGAIMIAPAVFPEAFRRVWDLVQEGGLAEAYAVFSREVLPFVHVFGIGDEIATTKALLASIGVFASPEVLPPLEPASAERTFLLRMAYDLCRGARSAAG